MNRARAAACLALAILRPSAAGAQERNIAAGLAGLGPRPVGSAAHAQAIDLALEALRSAGLRNVEARVSDFPFELAGRGVLSKEAKAAGAKLRLTNLTGVLPGTGDGEILLSAHYDTVPASPGAGDDASGCAAVIGAIADLSRTPLRRSIRVVLFDGEEAGLLGSRAWVDGLSSAERDRILAVINVEGVGWAGSKGPTVHSFPVRRGGERRLAPGWLVHAALRGAAAVEFPLSMVDPWIPVPAQLLVRANHVGFGADSDSFLAAGVPALFVSDGSFVSFDPAYHRDIDRADRLDAARLERWSAAIASIVRRLDGLDGRPLDEDQYLVSFGRVWLRRDLLWLCFGVWALLAVTAWRRHRDGSGRPPVAEFAFRALFLVSTLATPIFTATLLLPAAVLHLAPVQGAVARRLAVATGLLPAVGLAALTVVAAQRGFLSSWALGGPVTILLLATLAAFAFSLLRRPRPPLPA